MLLHKTCNVDGLVYIFNKEFVQHKLIILGLLMIVNVVGNYSLPCLCVTFNTCVRELSTHYWYIKQVI